MPSSGSTNHPTSARSPPSSSPKNGISGAAARARRGIDRSLAMSVSLTQSPGRLLADVARGTAKPSRTTRRAASRGVDRDGEQVRRDRDRGHASVTRAAAISSSSSGVPAATS